MTNLISSTISWLRRLSPVSKTLILAFLFSLLLVSPVFLPAYHDINPDDEAKYIASGGELLRGQWRDLAWGPLLAFIYAPATWLTQHLPYGFFAAAGLGHLCLFALLWWSALALARRFEPWVNPVVMAGLLAVFAGTTLILGNSSFAGFAVCSALALVQVVAYAQAGQVRHLWRASLWIGLGTLVRNDGLLLFASFLLLVGGWRLRAWRQAWGQHGRHILAALLPFVLVVMGYQVISTWPNVTFEIGTMRRTYLAFEQGQWVMAGNISWDEVVDETRRLYGTPEENGYNVFTAIARHPQTYAARLKVVLTGLPDLVLASYGKRMAAALLLLALVGVWALIRRRAFGLLAILAVWPLHLLAYFLTFFQAGYLLMPFFMVLLLAALGIGYVLQEAISARARLIGSGVLLAALLYTLADNKMALLAGVAMLTGCLGLGWFFRTVYPPQVAAVAAGMLLLAGGLVLREPYPFPDFAAWGSLPEEKSIAYLQHNFSPGSRLAGCKPLPALAARLQPVSLPADDAAFDYDAWLDDENLAAIYVDACARQQSPALLDWITRQTGHRLQSVAIFDPGSIQIFAIQSP
jgi:hypothetical protein